MTKVFDVTLTQVGAFIGGVLSMRLGVMGVLLGAVLGAGSKLLGVLVLVWLASRLKPGSTGAPGQPLDL